MGEEIIFIGELILLLILLLFSAFFSSTETALFSLDKLDLEKIHDHKKKKIIALFFKKTRSFLITILLGNLLVNVAASSLTTAVSLYFLDKEYVKNFFSFLGITSEWVKVWGLSVSAALISILILLFGEITPKIYALKNSLSLSQFAAPKILFFYKIFSPAITLIDKATEFIMNKVLKTPFSTQTQPFISLNEWKKILHLSTNEGILEQTEKDMIYHIFKFGEIVAREIMIPRIKIVALDSQMKVEKALKIIRREQFSRFPIYHETLDNIVGIIHVKDILRILKKGDLNVEISSFARKPIFVPETKKIDDILNLMRKQKTQMVIVVDEYGGTEGLLTMEDILEEVVGEIMDEHDEDERTIERIGDNEWIVDAQIPFHELNEKLSLNFNDDEFASDTLGGILMEIKGEIPEKGSQIDYQGYRFIILEGDKRKIDKVKILKLAANYKEDIEKE